MTVAVRKVVGVTAVPTMMVTDFTVIIAAVGGRVRFIGGNMTATTGTAEVPMTAAIN